MSHTKQFISHLSRNKKAVQIKQSFTFKKYLLSLLRELERRNEIREPWEYGETSTFVSRHGAGGSWPIILFPNASGIAMASKSLSTSRRVAVSPRAENVQACPCPSLWLQVVSMNDPSKPKNLHWVFSESSNPHGPGQGAPAACASAKYVQEGVGSENWCLAIPGKMKKQEEIALQAGGNKDFNPPRPTLLTQANQDLCES